MKLIFLRRQTTPYGGAERYLRRLVKLLEQRKIDTDVIHDSTPGWLPSWIRVLLYDHRVCRAKRRHKSPVIYFALDRISCPDIYRAGDGVHRAFLRSRGFSLNPLHPIYLWLERRTFERSKIIIANSELVRKEIMEEYKIPGEKIRIIYNGVPLPETIDKSAARKELLLEFGIQKSLPMLLFVGSGFRRKGVEEFLTTLSRISSPFIAFVVGREKRLERYRQMAKRLGLENRIIFTGPRRDVERFFAAADLFLFPTHYEPFSNVVLEALGYGNIVLTTRQNGAAEILPDSWVLKAPDDPSASKIIEDYLHAPVRLRDGQMNARRIAENHPIERNVNETLKVIGELSSRFSSPNVDISLHKPSL